MDLTSLSENLRRIRQARKLSQADLAERAGLSRVGYRNVETGSVVPKADTLARLAEALDVGLEDLVRPVSRLSAVRFRGKKRMTTREAILADVGRWLDDYSALEELLDDRAGYALADLIIPGKGQADRAAVVAQKAREALNLKGGEPIRDICGLLEDHGVKLFAPSLATDEFFGLSVGPQDRGPAVVVNTWDRITVERWIFTAAHELGHLLLHQDAYDVASDEEREEEEKEADLFASEFLMPTDVFNKEWEEARGLPLIDAVFKLKAIFRVSWKTVVFRLAEQEEHDKGQVWRKFYGSYRRRYQRSLKAIEEPAGLPEKEFWTPAPNNRLREEPENLSASLFREDRLSRLVRRALDQEAISMSRAAEILGRDLMSMRELAESWIE